MSRTLWLVALVGCPQPGTTGPTTGPVGVDNDNDGYSVESGDCDDDNADINPGVAEVACDNIDNDCNGEVDDGVAGWLMKKSERDGDGDGTPDSAVDFTYLDDGQPLTEAQTWVNPDFSDFEYLMQWSYDQGRVTMLDRTGLQPREETYETDARGNITRAEIDAGSTGTLTRIQEFAYDDDDQVIQAWTDSDADGKWDLIQQFDYEDGVQVGSRADSNADGTWDFKFERTTDSEGRVIETRLDNDDDDDWDVIATFVFDGAGPLIRMERDNDGDGKVDDVETYTNNADGQPTDAEMDLGNDGTVDSRWQRTYHSDGNEHLRRADLDGDTEWDSVVESQEYDADGNVLRVRSDDNADDTWDRSWVYTYDRSKRTSIRYDSDGDGKPNNIFEWSFDKDLNLINDRYDNQNDGVWDQENWYTWECGS